MNLLHCSVCPNFHKRTAKQSVFVQVLATLSGGADLTLLPGPEPSRAERRRQGGGTQAHAPLLPAGRGARCTTGVHRRAAWRRAAVPSPPRAAAVWGRTALAAAAAAPPHGLPRTPGWAPTQRSGGAAGAWRRSGPVPQEEPPGLTPPITLRSCPAGFVRDPPRRGPARTLPAAGSTVFV